MSTDQWNLINSMGDNPIFVNRKTGETEKAIPGFFREGSQTLSPEEVARRREYGKEKELERQEMLGIIGEKTYRNRKARESGRYIRMDSSRDAFADLPPDILARATYLATFRGFDDDCLFQSQRKRIKKSDLPIVMKLSKRSCDEFWKKVDGKYFSLDRGGYVHTLGDRFISGRLNADFDREYQRLYITAIRELYEKVTSRQHKRLGFVFKMLPFLNFEFNVLCHNPSQKDFKKVRSLTVFEFCEQIGFDKTHAAELAREYGKILLTVNGRQEVFCKFLFDGNTVENATIYINPLVIFKGSDFKKVAAIGVSFAADSQNLSGK